MERSRCLHEEDLLLFRTLPCVYKSLKRDCPNSEDCSYSHCLSWCRRNPTDVAYRPALCPYVIFRKERNQTRVRNFCNRGRLCPYSHTKEEQMYHPAVYKTRICRTYPECQRVYCPFAHGASELRRCRQAYRKPVRCDNPSNTLPTPQGTTWNTRDDEPNSQDSYSSNASFSINGKSYYSEGSYPVYEYWSQPSLDYMKPLGNLVLGSDGNLYINIIPAQ